MECEVPTVPKGAKDPSGKPKGSNIYDKRVESYKRGTGSGRNGSLEEIEFF